MKGRLHPRTIMAVMLLLVGCSSESEPQGEIARVQTTSPEIWSAISGSSRIIDDLSEEDIRDADLSILFIGNSHTAAWDVPGLVADVARRRHPADNVLCSRAKYSGFLIEQAEQESTLAALQMGAWDYVVLQALKYSTSGKYDYPFDGAIKLISLAQENGSQVVMFPEWGRLGEPNEGRRVQSLHEELSEITGATVAPVGIAWDHALAEHPELALHASDGNHATQLGALLTAHVIYAALARDASVSSQQSDASNIERFLEHTAWRTVAE